MTTKAGTYAIVAIKFIPYVVVAVVLMEIERERLMIIASHTFAYGFGYERRVKNGNPRNCTKVSFVLGPVPQFRI